MFGIKKPSVSSVVKSPFTAVATGGLSSMSGLGAGGQYSPLGMITDPSNNALAKALGLDGGQGDYYQGTLPPELEKMKEFHSDAFDQEQNRNAAQGSNQVQGAMQSYANGGMSLQDALAAAGNGMDKSGQQSAIWDKFQTDGVTGSKLASQQVQSNPILGKIFGQGGLQDRTLQEEQDLSKRGYSLQPEDYEAYGQASGQLANLFGQQEQGLAQSLADRGLASSSNGAAAAGYAGLQGNKFEQLAGLQRNIADNRMQMNLQRLTQTRQMLNQMTDQGTKAINDQYGRQLSGVQEQFGERKATADRDLDRYKTDSSNLAARNEAVLNKYGIQAGDAYKSYMDKEKNKGQTLLQGFGTGLYQGTQSLGQRLPGKLEGLGGGGIG